MLILSQFKTYDMVISKSTGGSMQNENINNTKAQNLYNQWNPENIVQVNRQNIIAITEKICTDKNCKFRQQALRIFVHLIASIDKECKVAINAKQLSKKLDVHYDTVSKCLKYLRNIEVLNPLK